MKMTVEGIVEVVNGFNNGKEIQFTDLSRWHKSSLKSLDSILKNIINDEIYRVKPEDKYRPYKTIDEAMELMGKVIKQKNCDNIYIVNNITSDNIDKTIYINGLSAEYIFEKNEYYDKSMRHIPLGVKE